MPETAPSFIWVEDLAQLESLCLAWQQLEQLALDTEFIRTSTFYPLAALLQINDGENIYLLDIPALGAPACLQELMVSGPTKILHSCSEDLEVFQHWLGVMPNPLVDTQLAVALVTQDTSVGYQRLVQDYLGIELDKGETRSNWLQRPLTSAQQIYAAQDVEHLLKVWQLLQEELRQVNKLDILHAESQWLLEEALGGYVEDAWQRCKQAWRLPARELGVLQSLSIWREEQAQLLDRPRSRVMQNTQLMLVAERLPHSLSDLSSLGEFSSKWINKFGSSLIETLVQAAHQPAENWPTPLTAPQTASYKQARKLIKEGINQLAQEFNLAPDLLAKRKYLEDWTQALSQQQQPEVPENWPAWRREPLQQLMQRLYSGLVG